MNKDPQQLEKFLLSQENKWNLQLLVRDIVSNKAYGDSTMIVRSFVSDDEALPATATGGEEISDRLNWIEKAHARFGSACRVGCSCATMQDSPVELTIQRLSCLHTFKTIIIDIFKDNIN